MRMKLLCKGLIYKKCNVEGLKIRMKFLSEGLTRNIMLNVWMGVEKDEIPLRDKKCSIEGLKVRVKFLCGWLISNVMSRKD